MIIWLIYQRQTPENRNGRDTVVAAYDDYASARAAWKGFMASPFRDPSTRYTTSQIAVGLCDTAPASSDGTVMSTEAIAGELDALAAESDWEAIRKRPGRPGNSPRPDITRAVNRAARLRAIAAHLRQSPPPTERAAAVQLVEAARELSLTATATAHQERHGEAQVNAAALETLEAAIDDYDAATTPAPSIGPDRETAPEIAQK